MNYGTYDDNKTYKNYLEFSQSWLTKSYELLKNGGRICINVPIDIEKHSLMADLTILAKRAGFRYKGTIIWNKQSLPLRGKQNKKWHTMAFSKNIEVILIFYKNEWNPVRAEFKEMVNEVWKFSGESRKRVGHPAPFPPEIPRRLIKMFSEPGDIVLDPFSGSGTTVAACIMCNRKGIGVEIDENFFKNMVDRLKNKRW